MITGRLEAECRILFTRHFTSLRDEITFDAENLRPKWLQFIARMSIGEPHDHARGK